MLHSEKRKMKKNFINSCSHSVKIILGTSVRLNLIPVWIWSRRFWIWLSVFDFELNYISWNVLEIIDLHKRSIDFLAMLTCRTKTEPTQNVLSCSSFRWFCDQRYMKKCSFLVNFKRFTMNVSWHNLTTDFWSLLWWYQIITVFVFVVYILSKYSDVRVWTIQPQVWLSIRISKECA